MSEMTEAKILLVACELAGDCFRSNSLPGHAAKWVNRNWGTFRPLAERIVKALDRVDSEARQAHAPSVTQEK